MKPRSRAPSDDDAFLSHYGPELVVPRRDWHGLMKHVATTREMGGGRVAAFCHGS